MKTTKEKQIESSLKNIEEAVKTIESSLNKTLEAFELARTIQTTKKEEVDIIQQEINDIQTNKNLLQELLKENSEESSQQELLKISEESSQQELLKENSEESSQQNIEKKKICETCKKPKITYVPILDEDEDEVMRTAFPEAYAMFDKTENEQIIETESRINKKIDANIKSIERIKKYTRRKPSRNQSQIAKHEQTIAELNAELVRTKVTLRFFKDSLKAEIARCAAIVTKKYTDSVVTEDSVRVFSEESVQITDAVDNLSKLRITDEENDKKKILKAILELYPNDKYYSDINTLTSDSERLIDFVKASTIDEQLEQLEEVTDSFTVSNEHTKQFEEVVSEFKALTINQQSKSASSSSTYML